MKRALAEFRVQLLIVLFCRHVRPDRADRQCDQTADPERQKADNDIDKKHDECALERRIAHAERSEKQGKTCGKPDILCRLYDNCLRSLRCVLFLIHNDIFLSRKT